MCGNLVDVVLRPVETSRLVAVPREVAVSKAFAGALAAVGWVIEAVGGRTTVGRCEGCGVAILDGDPVWDDMDGVLLCKECMPTEEDERVYAGQCEHGVPIGQDCEACLTAGDEEGERRTAGESISRFCDGLVRAGRRAQG